MRSPRRPLDRITDRALHKQEQSTHVDVGPKRVGSRGASTPDPDPSSGAVTDDVDTLHVERALLTVADAGDQLGDSHHLLVRGCLVDTTTSLEVGGCDHASHVAGRGADDEERARRDGGALWRANKSLKSYSAQLGQKI